MSNLNSEQDDQRRAEAILAENPSPPEIVGVSIKLQNDHSGSPSMFLSFEVEVGVDLQKEQIARLSQYMAGIVDKLIQSGISRFPYISLDQAA